ncbi:MAG: hypothetical protein AB1432_01160 [Bacteroidota bacterium]|jgi:hypothetical protein
MNKKQKLFLGAGIIVILLSFIVWAIYGFEIFTKTQVLVESKDELFGWSEKKWIDKFLWGLDLTLIVSTGTILISGLLIYFVRNKNNV